MKTICIPVLSAFFTLACYGYEQEKALTFKYHSFGSKDIAYLVQPTNKNPDRETFTLSPDRDAYTIACKAGDIFQISNGRNSYLIKIRKRFANFIYLAPTFYGYDTTIETPKKNIVYPAPDERAVEFTSILPSWGGGVRMQKKAVYTVTPTQANPSRESFNISKQRPSHTIACKVGDMFNVTDGNNSYIVTIPNNIYDAIYLLPKDYRSDWWEL